MSERILRINIRELQTIRVRSERGLAEVPIKDLAGSAHQLHLEQGLEENIRRLGFVLNELKDADIEFDIPYPESGVSDT